MATEAKVGWSVMVEPWFLALPRDELTDRAKVVMQAIAARAGRRRFVWLSTRALAAMVGRSEAYAKRGVADLADRGWVLRSMGAGRKVRRVGLILLRRPDSSRWPVAEGIAGVETARIDLARHRREWERRRTERRRAARK